MTRARFPLVSLAASVALVTAGTPVAATSPTAGTQPRGPGAEAQRQGMDSDFAEVSDRVPGFGGASVDRQGRLTIYLKQPDRRAAALGALSAFGSPLGEAAARESNVVVRHADYDYRQLFGWKTGLTSRVFAIPGVVSVEIREEANRLAIGLATRRSQPAVVKLVASAGVPRAAVLYFDAERVRPAITLLDRVRPAMGGLAIRRYTSTASYRCTMGFNAYDPAGDRVIVTNSHCTPTMGSNNGARFYQPNNAGGNYLGQETKDPAFFTDSRCPSGYRCRNSDSALLTPAATTETVIGGIARTTERATASGTLTINSTNPRISIKGKAPYPGLYEDLDKVGSTTGWTHGLVTGTCKNVSLGNPDGGSGDVVILCSDFVQAGVGPGDSGSPVFRYSSGSATLLGILFGSTTTSNSFVFSAMQNLENELGTLRVNG